MKKYLEQLPCEIQEFISLAGQVASLRGMAVYLVGGFVRDLILGVKNLDLDIAVEGDGIVFAEDLASRLRIRLIRHRRFGTATVVLGHHLKIDIATARKEIYLKPAQLPVVEFGSLKDDLKRRDFTINAMAIDINQANFGRLLDFFGGKSDLKNKKVRILHDSSFVDDPTRILRAIRFEKRYNFKIEAKTLKLLKNALKNKMLEIVQPQRLRDELILILKEGSVFNQVKRLKELSGFNFVKSGLSVSKKTFDLFKNAKKEIDWFNSTHHKRRKLDNWLVYFMVLFDSLNLNDTKSVTEKFVLRKGEEKRILSVKETSDDFVAKLSRRDILASEIFALLEPLSYEAIIFLKAKSKNRNYKKHIEDFLEIYNDIRICISGHDLVDIGIMPGPLYQKIFSKVLQAKLNGQLITRLDELAFIKKLYLNINYREKTNVKA